MGLTYKISIVNWIFENILLKIIFMDLKLLMFHYNIVNISEILNKVNLLKTCLKFIYPTIFCIFCSHFQYEEKWTKIDYCKNQRIE